MTRIVGHGIDVVECARLERMVERHGQHFLARVFTAREQAVMRGSRKGIERLAGRFAVKEAVLKVLGTGWRNGIAWTDIETVNDALGKPIVNLDGLVAEQAEQMRIIQISVSITHTHELAIASAIALGE